MSLGLFDPTEPARTTVTKEEAGLQGRFEGLRGGLTLPNILQPLGQRGREANREGSSEFGAVQPHHTSLNHCDKEGSEAYREGSSEVGALWFVYIPDALFTSGFGVC